MSALTHKVDPDEPVSNLIAVVHRRLGTLYNPTKKSVLIRKTKIINEPELSSETSNWLRARRLPAAAAAVTMTMSAHRRRARCAQGTAAAVAGPTCTPHLRYRGPSVPPRRPCSELRPLSATMG